MKRRARGRILAAAPVAENTRTRGSRAQFEQHFVFKIFKHVILAIQVPSGPRVDATAMREKYKSGGIARVREKLRKAREWRAPPRCPRQIIPSAVNLQNENPRIRFQEKLFIF